MEGLIDQAEKKENCVSGMSVQEYATTKGIELQLIEFYGFPCRHTGEGPAKEIISSLEMLKPDLVLIENVDNFEGINYQKILDEIKNDHNFDQDIESSSASFLKVLLEHLLANGIEVQSIDKKFESEVTAEENHREMLFRLTDMRAWVSEAIKEIDDEKSWQIILQGWEDAKMFSFKLHREREEEMLSNVASVIVSSTNAKKIRKVAIIVGADHRSGIFESMAGRGDTIRLQESSFVRNRGVGNLSASEFPSFLLAKIIGSAGMDGGTFLAPWGSDHFAHEVETGDAQLTLEDVKKMFIKLKHRSLKREDLIVS